MNFRRITASLHSSDVVVIGFACVLSVVNLLFSARIPGWWWLILINCAATVLICVLAAVRQATGSKLLGYVHDWYVAPMVFVSFKEIYFMIKPIHGGRDYDDILIALDRWLFGTDPTPWMAHFSTPVVTEILQIAYTSFYFLFLILGYEMYRRRSLDLFHYFMFTCVYGFYLSYVGYFLLPAVGPRFTLHHFSALDRELPGVVLTPYLRWFVNAGESVPMGVPDAMAMAGAQRDVFPSGHTMLTLVLIYLSALYHVRVRFLMYIVGTLLIIATVYERYHYGIDLLAGGVFMIFCVLTAQPLYAGIKRSLGTLESRLPPSEAP